MVVITHVLAICPHFPIRILPEAASDTRMTSTIDPFSLRKKVGSRPVWTTASPKETENAHRLSLYWFVRTSFYTAELVMKSPETMTSTPVLRWLAAIVSIFPMSLSNLSEDKLLLLFLLRLLLLLCRLPRLHHLAGRAR